MHHPLWPQMPRSPERVIDLEELMILDKQLMSGLGTGTRSSQEPRKAHVKSKPKPRKHDRTFDPLASSWSLLPPVAGYTLPPPPGDHMALYPWWSAPAPPKPASAAAVAAAVVAAAAASVAMTDPRPAPMSPQVCARTRFLLSGWLILYPSFYTSRKIS